MKFNEFVEMKLVDAQINECAALFSEMDVDPYEYIHECLKDVDSVFAEGWWDGVREFGKNLWKGVSQFAGDTAAGARAGFNKAADTVAGPVAKFDAAERALKDLVDLLNKDQRFEKFKNVSDYIGKVLENLRSYKQMVPQLGDTEIKQDYRTRGGQTPSAMDASKMGDPKYSYKAPAMDVSKMGNPAYQYNPAQAAAPQSGKRKPMKKVV